MFFINIKVVESQQREVVHFSPGKWSLEELEKNLKIFLRKISSSECIFQLSPNNLAYCGIKLRKLN